MAIKKIVKTSKIIDVAKPGATAPDQTSKAVIITHRPMMADPMVTAAPSTEGTLNAKPSAPLMPATVKSPKLQAPVSISIESDEASQITKLKKPATKIKPPNPVDSSTAPLLRSAHGSTIQPVNSVAKAVPEPEPQLLESPVVDQVENKAVALPPTIIIDVAPAPLSEKPAVEPAKQNANPETQSTSPKEPDTTTNERIAELAAEAETQKVIALQKLLEEKTYYLPINSREKRKTKRFVLLGIVLSIILIAAWADIALDAGLIHIDNVKPVTHFFST
jgi:hypothetical protein